MVKQKGWQRVLSVMLAAVFILGMIPLVGVAATTFVSGNWQYVLEDNSARIQKYTGTASNVVVPSTIDSYRVGRLLGVGGGMEGYNAVFGTQVVTVTIPAGITLGSHVFAGCANLQSVNLPSDLTSTGGGIFSGCTSLKNIVLPSTLRSLGESAFSGCTSLKSILLPSALTSIGSFAFSRCNALENISIPRDASIYEYAFYQCSNLSTISFSAEYDANISPTAFEESKWLSTRPDGLLYIGKNAYKYINPASARNVVIQAGTTRINESAFTGCTNLESISLPESLTSIGSFAFQNCRNLLSIRFPSQVDFESVSIDKIFRGCLKLESISVSNNSKYTSIDGVLFNSDGTELILYPAGRQSAHYTIPQGTITISSNAFNPSSSELLFGNTTLCSVILSNSVQKIALGAFAYCPNLSSVTIPEGTTNINSYSFLNSDNVVIYGYADSYAQQYAATNGIPFVVLDAPQTTYGIAFNANGGSASPISTTITAGSSITTPTPTKSYTLSYNANGGNAVSPSSKSVSCATTGWYTAASGGTKRANAGASYTPTSSETIYAQWANPAMGTLPTPIRSGYTFKGWFTASSGGVQVTSSTTMTGNQTIYAQWNELSANIYNLGEETYRFSNYGDSDSAGGHCFGMSITSSAYYLRLLDLAIIGGNYTNGLYALSSNATVKAPICHYQKIQTSQAVVAGSWCSSNITSDWASVVNYVKSGKYDDTGALQLVYDRDPGGHAVNFLRYAVVSGQARIYVYDNNYPDVETYFYQDNQGRVYQTPKATFNGAITCMGLVDVAKYMTIAGKFDPKRVIYADKDAISINGVAALTMKGDFELGKRVMYEIPDNLNEVTIIPLVDNATFDYLDNEYSFGTINKDTVGIFKLSVLKEGTITQNPSLTITQSPAQTYTVTLNANGGSVSPTSISVTNGGTYSALPTPTRSGYAFDGWYTAASGGVKVNKTDVVNLTGDTTLYARWTANTLAKGIFGTNAKWYGAWWHYLLFFVAFGWIWMWF